MLGPYGVIAQIPHSSNSDRSAQRSWWVETGTLLHRQCPPTLGGILVFQIAVVRFDCQGTTLADPEQPGPLSPILPNLWISSAVKN